MNPKATLLLGGDVRITVPVARSLARHGVPVYCARFGRLQGRIRSRAIRRCFSFADVDDPRLPGQFLASVDRESIEYLMPCDDSSLRFIARNYAALSSRVRLGCPDAAAIMRVLDKRATLSLAQQCGIPIPRALQGGLHVDLGRVTSGMEFPLVARPTTKLKNFGYKALYFQTVEELRATAARTPEFFDDHIVEEYCPGDGVGIEVLLHQGQPTMVFQHRRVTENPRSGGASVVAEAEEPEPRLAEMAVRLLRALKWRGIAMVEFRHQKATGRTALIEVNGRFWGSLGLSALCGYDFAYAQWAYDHGVTPKAPEGSCRGQRARWTGGVFENIRDAIDTSNGTVWNEVKRSLPEFSPRIHDMVFSWSDPVPGISDTCAQLMEVIRAAVRRAASAALLHWVRKRVAPAEANEVAQ